MKRSCLINVILLTVWMIQQGCQGTQKVLLLSDRYSIRRISLEEPLSSKAVEIPIKDETENKNYVTVDYDQTTGYLYWANSATGRIHKSRLDGTGQEIVLEHQSSLEGIAVDWVAQNIYWVNSQDTNIGVMRIEDGSPKTLVSKDMVNPRGICVEPIEGYIFWTDWGKPVIERARLDGTERQVIVDDDSRGSRLRWPNDVAIDYVTKRLYWGDAGVKSIESVGFNGQNRKITLIGMESHIFSVSILGDYIYWSDWRTNYAERVNKQTGENRTRINREIKTPMGLKAVDLDLEIPYPGSNPCAVNNGNCTHLCLYRPPPSNLVCAIPDNHGTDQMVIFAARIGLEWFPLDNPSTQVRIPTGYIPGKSSPVAVDYHVDSSLIYYSDIAVVNNSAVGVQSVRLNGSDREVVLEGRSIEGLAIDQVAQNLYWTDIKAKVIGVSRLNGSFAKLIITGLGEPRAICVDSMEGYIYWTDWGKPPAIERAYLDGSKRSVIVKDEISHPNGLTIDLVDRKLFWGDAQTDRIEVCDLDGSSRRVLISDGVQHIFGLALMGEYIYWTDWMSRNMERANKRTGQDRTVLLNKGEGLMGLKPVDLNNLANGTNTCGENNGGCSHLCLFRPPPLTRICACPENTVLHPDNEGMCIPVEKKMFIASPSAIKWFSLDNPKDFDLRNISLHDAAGTVESIAVDPSNDRMFWSDVENRQIKSVPIEGDGSLMTIIEKDLKFPESVAVDWIRGNLYWVDPKKRHVEVARLDGSSRRLLVWEHLVNPGNLVVDPIRRFLYWTDGSVIERAHLDGSHREVVVHRLGHVTDLTLDPSDGRLFWIDLHDERVKSLNPNDDDGLTSVLKKGIRRSFGISVLGDFFYYSYTSSFEQKHQINVARTQDGGDSDVIKWGIMGVLKDIAVMDLNTKSDKDNVCDPSKNHCSHLCFAPPANNTVNADSHVCACPTFYTLNQDGTTCSEPVEYLLAVTNDTFFWKADTQESISNHPFVAMPGDVTDHITTIKYERETETFSVSDNMDKLTKREINEENVGQIGVTGSDLAIDPYTQNIYWTTDNAINVKHIRSLMDSEAPALIIALSQMKPGSLALYPEKSEIFFINMLTQPRIEKISMEGSGRKILFPVALNSHSLILDKTNKRLYWVENVQGTSSLIKVSDLQGTRVISTPIITGKEITQLIVHRDRVYWVEGTNTVGSIDKRAFGDTRAISRIPSTSFKIERLLSVNRPVSLSWHPCFYNKGNCSDICVINTNQEKRCLCPSGKQKGFNERTCVIEQECANHEFRCTSGSGICIPLEWRCDGVPECEDRSDEMNCNQKCDETTQFFCADGLQCIEKGSYCDANIDCWDGSDERDCQQNLNPKNSSSSISGNSTSDENSEWNSGSNSSHVINASSSGFNGSNVGYNESNVGDNCSNVGFNGSNVGFNGSNVGFNESNVGLTVSNGSTVGFNGSNVGFNSSNVGLNESNIGVNGSNIGFNESSVGFNGSNVGLNGSNVGFNGSIVGFNESNVGFNGSNVGFNSSNVGFNESNVGFNESNVGFNGSNVGFNSSNVGFNESNMGLNYSKEVITKSTQEGSDHIKEDDSICPCDLPQTYDAFIDEFCKLDTDYAMRVSVKNVRKVDNGIQLNVRKRIKFFKSKKTAIGENRQTPQIVIKGGGLSCCDGSFQKRGRYVLMGKLIEDKQKMVMVSYVKFSTGSKSEHRRAIKAVQQKDVCIHRMLFNIQQLAQRLRNDNIN